MGRLIRHAPRDPVATDYNEGELIGFGFAIEQATKARRAPKYTPTLVQ